MVGIPQGRFSSVAGLGIQTRRTGCASWFSLRVLTKASLWAGVRDFLPSTPAVFFPWCNYSAYHILILRTAACTALLEKG